MKNKYLLILPAFILLLTGSCKKSGTPNPPSDECMNSTFADTLDISMQPAYVVEDNKGNITVLGNHSGVIAVLRLNSGGNLL